MPYGAINATHLLVAKIVTLQFEVLLTLRERQLNQVGGGGEHGQRAVGGGGIATVPCNALHGLVHQTPLAYVLGRETSQPHAGKGRVQLAAGSL